MIINIEFWKAVKSGWIESLDQDRIAEIEKVAADIVETQIKSEVKVKSALDVLKAALLEGDDDDDW